MSPLAMGKVCTAWNLLCQAAEMGGVGVVKEQPAECPSLVAPKAPTKRELMASVTMNPFCVSFFFSEPG